MTFDVIDITQDEVDELTVIQQKLIRTAQQKKNSLKEKLEEELEELKLMISTNNVKNSTIYEQTAASLKADYESELAVLVEQLQYNLSIREPTTDDDTGDSGTDDTGYMVDYELTYIERYIMVRDYYLTIEDANERVALLQADTVAQDYLGTYYNVLFDYLNSLT